MNKMATEPMAPAEVVDEAPKKRRRVKMPAGKSSAKTIIMLIVPAILLAIGGYWWLTSGGSVSTDDAADSPGHRVGQPTGERAGGRGACAQRREGEARRHPVPDRSAALPGRTRTGAGVAGRGAAADARPAHDGGGHRRRHSRRAGQSGNQAECARPAVGAAEARLHDQGRLRRCPQRSAALRKRSWPTRKPGPPMPARR